MNVVEGETVQFGLLIFTIIKYNVIIYKIHILN